VDGRPARIAAAEVGDQNDAVAEESHAGASAHQAFLQFQVGDAAFVDTGVVRGGDPLGDSMPVFVQGSGKAGERGSPLLASSSIQPGKGVASWCA
jgi:hypothetical protein